MSSPLPPKETLLIDSSSSPWGAQRQEDSTPPREEERYSEPGRQGSVYPRILPMDQRQLSNRMGQIQMGFETAGTGKPDLKKSWRS